MSTARGLDDPESLNAFLKVISGTPITTPTIAPVGHRIGIEPADGNNKLPVTDDITVDHQDLTKEVIGDSGQETPHTRSRAASMVVSPAVGLRAPPPTPAAHTLSAEVAVFLEPIIEDRTDALLQLAEKSDLRLKDSKYATRGGLRYPVAEFRKLSTLTTLQRQDQPANHVAASSNGTPKIRKETTVPAVPDAWMDDIVSDFRGAHIHDVKGNGLKKYEGQSHVTRTPSATNFPADLEYLSDARNAGTVDDGIRPADFIESKDPHSVQNNEEKAIKNTLPDNPAEEKVSQDLEKSGDSPSSLNATFRTSQKATAIASPQIEMSSPIKASSKVTELIKSNSADEIEEDRENLTHFKSWGKAPARDRPAARIRKIKLSGLPTIGTDLTLVQGLISGGAIDNFALAASGIAYVTFISGDACDKFCEKYPNGLTFKHNGRTQIVLVDKCTDVDVISGMLQGYLDCGASRCVRAIGADEDWGMKALQKLAVGRGRKVENIIDNYRNENRTITFRFTNISDAVQFKAALLRDEDWEASIIQFIADPCEKASDVHLE